MVILPVPPSAPAGWERTDLVRLVDVDGSCAAWVSPALGGNTIALAMWIDQQWRHLLFIESPGDLRARPTRYGCPVLFPFPGYARDARYRWCGRTRALPINGPDGRSHVHGFAHDRAWRVVEEEGDHVTLELATLRDLTTDERTAYPFDIVLRQIVMVANGALTISLEAFNQGNEVAPVGLGLHPYVDPSFLNCARQDLVARLPGTAQRVLDGPMPTGDLRTVVSSTRALRELEELVICMTDLGDDASASLYGTDGLVVECDFLSGWNDFVLYAPADQPSVALEPLTCSLSAASLNPATGNSLPALAPNRSTSAALRLRLAT